jgi:hypothetical protein
LAPDVLLDPFDRSKLPDDLDQAGRVSMFHAVMSALIEGRQPERAAALFIGGGGLSWLTAGGDLVRDYWKLSARRGSHATPQALMGELSSTMSDIDEN